MASRDIGFTTVGGLRVLYDGELVSQDLLNHFYTKKGERAMNPKYGCIAWDMLFELMTDANRNIIEEDVRRIISTEPRVSVIELTVEGNEENGEIIIRIQLLYKPLGTKQELQLIFDRQAVQAAQG